MHGILTDNRSAGPAQVRDVSLSLKGQNLQAKACQPLAAQLKPQGRKSLLLRGYQGLREFLPAALCHQCSWMKGLSGPTAENRYDQEGGTCRLTGATRAQLLSLGDGLINVFLSVRDSPCIGATVHTPTNT